MIAVSVYLTAFPVALAQMDGKMPFGGMVSFMMPCTCGEPNQWLFMAPLHLGAPSPVVGPLIYAPLRTLPGITLFDYYSVRIGGYLLGNYTPGVQSCQIYVGTGCVPLPALGEIFMVGTSGAF